ncbi:Mu-like prophage major head subunit gpT family protein [Roseiconus lacunae]|uniref:Mu-like prophage major head subunit gpT family protein n=1 Tax=Roseiconus lacunae TaxID=2605694 RepID=A0ABT7PDV9_9BACT|nr:Mu-like prophage major head subunit gpT family protein [Roseiconus lacunae]MDM4014682.1 Mu-like prophage major head subunit gpT family protein [Roseiconus lacunae]
MPALSMMSTKKYFKVLEAAACMTARLPGVEDQYEDEILQAAKDNFRYGIGLKELLMEAARKNGYLNSRSSVIEVEAQQYAFGINARFSTISIGETLANVANKFVMRGWDSVDKTPLRIAKIRPVTDFKQISTVSLFGYIEFEQVGPAGTIPHGTLGNTAYSNKADTYAKMLAITRTDIINDDIGALTTVPQKLGRGSALKLNALFWTKFLDNSAFFTSGRNNVSTDTGQLSLIGLEQANAIFEAQKDPNDDPLGVRPEILLVPTELRSTAGTLMNSEKIKGSTDGPDGNPWKDRFRVESSPYMSDSNYTGNSTSAWYLLADPEVLPVVEIAALGGRVEPIIEQADAAFSYLGIQMRGYSDIGVEMQEYRGGVRADGSTAD